MPDLAELLLFSFLLIFREDSALVVNRGFKERKYHTVGQIGVDLDIRQRERADVAYLLVEIDVIALKDLARGKRRAVFDI